MHVNKEHFLSLVIFVTLKITKVKTSFRSRSRRLEILEIQYDIMAQSESYA